ncbi:hypothetical protein D3C77_243870 [compost metagenome]
MRPLGTIGSPSSSSSSSAVVSTPPSSISVAGASWTSGSASTGAGVRDPPRLSVRRGRSTGFSAGFSMTSFSGTSGVSVMMACSFARPKARGRREQKVVEFSRRGCEGGRRAPAGSNRQASRKERDRAARIGRTVHRSGTTKGPSRSRGGLLLPMQWGGGSGARAHETEGLLGSAVAKPLHHYVVALPTAWGGKRAASRYSTPSSPTAP